MNLISSPIVVRALTTDYVNVGRIGLQTSRGLLGQFDDHMPREKRREPANKVISALELKAAILA